MLVNIRLERLLPRSVLFQFHHRDEMGFAASTLRHCRKCWWNLAIWSNGCQCWRPDGYGIIRSYVRWANDIRNAIKILFIFALFSANGHRTRHDNQRSMPALGPDQRCVHSFSIVAFRFTHFFFFVIVLTSSSSSSACMQFNFQYYHNRLTSPFSGELKFCEQEKKTTRFCWARHLVATAPMPSLLIWR